MTWMWILWTVIVLTYFSVTTIGAIEAIFEGLWKLRK